MSSTYGNNLKLSIFGQSHGSAIGMVLDGIPAGLPVDVDRLQSFLDRRAPGQNEWSTPRRESDTPEFLGGILDGYTCGAPVAAVIRNRNTRSGDYTNLKDHPRPGHADFTAEIKYGGFQDPAGGGHFSGRLTAPLCIAGGLCLQWLEQQGMTVGAHILKIGDVKDRPFNPLSPELQDIPSLFPVLDSGQGEAMRHKIAEVKAAGDSVGGIIECAVTGLPAGIGEPMFEGIESRLSQILFGIPAVKSVSFGDILDFACPLGSTSNDPFYWEGSEVRTKSNHCGGILGGISNGMPILFRVGIKPTPSISREQLTVSLSKQAEYALSIHGRHDPCIVPRAVCVVEAAAAIALYDLILGNTQTSRRKSLWI